jgi:hypothetical protein
VLEEKPKLQLKLNKPQLQLKLKTNTGNKVKKDKVVATPVKPSKLKKKKTTDNKLPQKPGMLPPKIFLKIINYFRTKYPNCFSVPMKPLAIGLHKEMINKCEEIGVSKTQIRRFCSAYCHRKVYKTILVVGAERVDLEGNVTSVVTEEEVKLNFKE